MHWLSNIRPASRGLVVTLTLSMVMADVHMDDKDHISGPRSNIRRFHTRSVGKLRSEAEMESKGRLPKGKEERRHNV